MVDTLVLREKQSEGKDPKMYEMLRQRLKRKLKKMKTPLKIPKKGMSAITEGSGDDDTDWSFTEDIRKNDEEE